MSRKILLRSNKNLIGSLTGYRRKLNHLPSTSGKEKEVVRGMKNSDAITRRR